MDSATQGCGGVPQRAAHAAATVVAGGAGGPPGTTLAGPTAAELSGLVGFFSEQIHVVIPAGARRFRMPGVRVHWSSRLDVADVHPVLQPRRTRLPRSLIDMVSWAANDFLGR
jgi:hypothetical protein